MEFFYSSRFKKQLHKASPMLKRRVRERLLLLEQDEYHPLLRTHPLQGEYAGCRSINITGDWRLIYKKIDDSLIRIDALGTHGELYT